MFSFSIGNFGVILTRRTILYIVMVLTTMLAIYVFILVEETVNHEISKYTKNTNISDYLLNHFPYSLFSCHIKHHMGWVQERLWL